jgi:hypothetical protein
MSHAVPTFAERHAAVESTSRLAGWAAAAVLVSSVLVPIACWAAMGPELLRYAVPDTRMSAALIVTTSDVVARLVALGLFLTWLYRAVSNARALGVATKWGPLQAVVAQVVPLISLVLPYYVMRELHRASDPSPLHDAPMFRERAEANYREGAREVLAPPRWRLPAPILAWCVLYAATTLSGVVYPLLGAPAARYLGAACGMAAGVLCALIVRSVDARQRERCRRLEASERAGAAL